MTCKIKVTAFDICQAPMGSSQHHGTVTLILRNNYMVHTGYHKCDTVGKKSQWSYQ
jgi:hypothetical protein